MVLNPAGFYRVMQKTGGYLEPSIYVLVIGVIVGVFLTLIALLGRGFYGAAGDMVAVLFLPILAIGSSFVSGVIMFVLWKKR